ncbi:unnamed protein product [Urochloa decumbens]|uniref:Uncharacterized protein n=1 Tax=Urochloa decumbens TaxID=240449 RepID=A0ABC8WL05_9POAL
MKAAMSTVILLHLLLISTATAAASPATSSLLPPDGQGWAAARRLLLPRLTAAMATATNTFHVKGAAHQPATAKPSVEFNASTRSAPGSKFNPRQN